MRESRLVASQAPTGVGREGGKERGQGPAGGHAQAKAAEQLTGKEGGDSAHTGQGGRGF